MASSLLGSSPLSILEDAEKHVKLSLSKRDQGHGISMRLVTHIITTEQLSTVPMMSLVINVGDGTQTFKWLSLAVSP